MLMLLSFTIRFCDNEPSVDGNETKILKRTFGKEIHIGKASQIEQKHCPDGQSRLNICAKKTCKHSFELIKDKGEIKLKKSYSGEMLNADKFCLTKYNGTGIFDRTARVCMDDIETATKKADKKSK